jgi:hypothetical protein
MKPAIREIIVLWAGLVLSGLGCGTSSSTGGGGGYLDVQAKAKQKADETTAVNNLKQIGLALHGYHNMNMQFPGPPEQGKAMLSWRVHILPFLEQTNLYRQFKLNEPWDGPNNKKLLEMMPAIYLDPRFQKKEESPGETYFLGFGGDGGVLGQPGGTSLVAILNANGVYSTFLVVEAGDPVPWTKPEELHVDEKGALPALGGPKRIDFLALFCDGHIRRIPANTKELTLRSMMRWNNVIPFAVPGEELSGKTPKILP